MSRTIQYVYKNQTKTIPFSYQEFHTIQEAVAAHEGIDLTPYLKMEQSVEAVSDQKTVREYRDAHFKKLGFGKIALYPNNVKIHVSELSQDAQYKA